MYGVGTDVVHCPQAENVVDAQSSKKGSSLDFPIIRSFPSGFETGSEHTYWRTRRTRNILSSYPAAGVEVSVYDDFRSVISMSRYVGK